MTLFVPFDGSDLAEAALVRATEFATVFDEPVVAATVIPSKNEDYASDHGWIDGDEGFDGRSVVASLNEQVTSLSPEATFRHEIVDRYAPSGYIANRIRKMARNADASMVFIGSENAGHLVTALSSVGANVAADESYDVVIVRNRSPTKIRRLRESSPHRRAESDFYRDV